MDSSVLVAVLAGLVVPVVLLATFQLFAERLSNIRRPSAPGTGLLRRAGAAVGHGIEVAGGAVESARERGGSAATRRRGLAHARRVGIALGRSTDWDAETGGRPSIARGERSGGLVAVGPGRPERDERWPETGANGEREIVAPSAELPLRVRITTTGLDGETTVLDDDAPTVSCPRCGYRHSSAASYCRRCGYSQSNRPLTRWQGAPADEPSLVRRARG